MRSAAPTARRDARPPVPMGAAPPQGAADRPFELRPTVRVRIRVRPVLDPNHAPGFAPDHPYVRRFWTAALGPGAVADLLRLITAARRGWDLPRPLHLPSLAQAGLVRADSGKVLVRSHVPPLPVHLARRLPPFLQRELA